MKSETRKSGTKNKSMIYKEVLGSMEIRKPAVAGTLESSDCQVTVEPGEGNIEFALESAVINQYGNQIKRVVMDKGALDCTIRARVEGAVFRAAGQYDNLPWGGAIR